MRGWVVYIQLRGVTYRIELLSVTVADAMHGARERFPGGRITAVCRGVK